MIPSANAFNANARRALNDATLQSALGHVRRNFIERRKAAMDRLPEFDALRDQARDLKDHVLANLGDYLARFEEKATEAGGQVHWCETAEDARERVLEICRAAGARSVTKGKSMIGEEIAINDHLAANGIRPIETDLGEYIIQLRGEAPSHLIAPAVHVTKGQVEETFRQHHTDLDPRRDLEDPATLLAEARAKLRQCFLEADVGITGANFLVAETGSAVVVTNEGNGDLTMDLPPVHIVLASIEKVVPTLEDATTLLRVLARSATGQEMSVYTTLVTGPRRKGEGPKQGDRDGPTEFHVILLDNGRSDLLGTEFEAALRCIRCGACLNHCPVYHAVGGHAYGWVYSGPIGAVLTPALIGIENATPLPGASSLCGRCESVCPVRIPLPDLLRRWRERVVEERLDGLRARWALRLWREAALRPPIYRIVTRMAARILAFFGAWRGRLAWFPLAGNWTRHRDLPAPQGATFMDLYRKRKPK